MEANHAGRKFQAEWEFTENPALSRAEFTDSEPVGCAHLSRIACPNLAIMVAPYGWRTKLLKSLKCFARPKGSGYTVSEIDDHVRASSSDVSKHRVKCRNVAMNVSQNSNAHSET
jgi:hypothetical protein